MSNIFATTKEPALFPMAFPLPTISKEEYRLFYKHERSLFTLLIMILHRDVVRSIPVIGFLLWLERVGYTSKNLAQTLVNCLTPDVINRVVDEVMICIRILENKSNNFMSEGSSRHYDISLLQRYLDRKSLNLEELRHNQDTIFNEVSSIAKEVSSKAFEDILEKFKRDGGPSLMHSPQDPTIQGSAGGLQHIGPVIGFHQAPTVGDACIDAQIMKDLSMAQRYQQMVAPRGTANQLAMFTSMIDCNPLYATNHGSSVIRELPEKEVPPEDRTIFLTFSKGYPISESEVRNCFTRFFGDIIESIYMQPVEPDDQSLYARIVVRSASMARAVVERDGADGKSKYYINGKHAWARKFVQRKPST